MNKGILEFDGTTVKMRTMITMITSFFQTHGASFQVHVAVFISEGVHMEYHSIH